MPANVTYEVTSARIFDDTYDNSNYTSAQIEQILEENYPFEIVFSVDTVTIGITDTTNFRMRVYWPYETGNDSLDTYWGKKAYDYEQSHANSDEIEVHIKIIATQAQ